MHTPSLIRYAWLSIATALVTIGLKMSAYAVTGSVGLLSDALESIVNLVAAIVALIVLNIAAQPPDEDHEYGHAKVEYFSSGVEGALILVAAGSIIYAAWPRLIAPQPLEQVGLGLGISVFASLINFAVSRIIATAGHKYNSITLEADAKHLMTDVWTSIGVLVGIGAVWLTGWERLDPIVAILVAINILWSGFDLIRRSVLGLLDTALPNDERLAIQKVLDRYRAEGVQFHALRTRQAGMRRFVSMHVLVSGDLTVRDGHNILEKIEADVRSLYMATTVFTHLEPIDDPASFEDTQLDRVAKAERPAVPV